MRTRQIVEYMLVMVLLGVAPVGFLSARVQRVEVGKQVSLKGRVTDSMCGAKHTVGADNENCVHTCVKRGSHYALLAENHVYALIGHDKELDNLADKLVTVSGTIEDGQTIRIASLQSDTARNSSNSVSTPSSGNSAESPLRAIKGLVRDIACPIQNKAATARTFNLKCALECVKAGSPIVIQADDGTLYMPISSVMPDEDQRSRLLPFVGKYVEIHGQVFERQGAQAITVQDIRELKGIALTKDAE